MSRIFNSLTACLVACSFFASCEEQKEHIAPAIREQDSVAMMTSYGVNALISDSGVIKYRIVAERWEYNQNINPPKSIFEKGIFLTQFDEKFHVQGYIQADTAYNYERQRLWELRGRVRVLTKRGLKFTSEELFWDEARREFYSFVPFILVTPERTMQGTYFRSNDRMTHYYVSNSKGAFSRQDFDKDEKDEKEDTAAAQKPTRPLSPPQRRTK